MIHIDPAVRPETAALRLSERDNIAIARAALPEGQEVELDGQHLRTRQAIAAGHKLAIRPIAAGEAVLRYGQPIGRARRAIAPGEHVHSHNLEFAELQVNAGLADARLTGVGASRPAQATFDGYARDDGRVGTRNYVAVAAASNCAAHVVQMLEEEFRGLALPEGVDGVVAFPHGEGCGHSEGPDTAQLRRTLSGVINHPNVGAALLIGLGCEVNQIDAYFPPGTRRTDHVVGMTVQESGGTRASVQEGVKHVHQLLERAAAEKRSRQSAAHIVLGLNCGGSDSFSGVSANPALGICSDLLVEQGGTAVLAETTEIVGAEHLLLLRAQSPQVAEQLRGVVNRYKDYLRQFGASFDDNPSPGNKAGGITTILEKSLGAVAKGGSSPLVDVVDYAAPVRAHGFVFMNTPGYDPVSLTGLAAGGVNVIAFTTGRGSGIGFPTIPVLKIASNSRVFQSMRDNIDVNAGKVIDGESTLEEMGREIFEAMLETASGRHTASERLGHREFVPWRIGPVL